MPALRSLIIGDEASAWRAAGFDVDAKGWTSIGDVDIELIGASGDRGILGWRIDDLPDELATADATIDGIATSAPDGPRPVTTRHHENLVSHLDHVVMFSDDLQRTISSLEQAGFEARRVRDIPGTEPLRQQVFFWAGSTIIELVGPAEPSGNAPASLWGLAVTCDDLDLAHDRLDGGLGTPKTAVQKGRRIATLRTRDLDISTAVAFMTPHVPTAPSPDA